MGAFELERVDLDDPAIVVAVLSGELDLTNVGQLIAELEEATAGRALVLDLNRLLFIDSAALHGLFRLARTRERGLAIVIEPGAPVATTLAIVDFRQAAMVAGTRDEARAALATPSAFSPESLGVPVSRCRVPRPAVTYETKG